uniref:Uncharacterized protein n=1 Tax=Anguilla anguilla TaxID=7936 RepID=A0A0E9QHW7_ANGAN
MLNECSAILNECRLLLSMVNKQSKVVFYKAQTTHD